MRSWDGRVDGAAGGGDRPLGRVGGYTAYADASLQGRDAAWAAVVYEGERLVRVACAAGEAASIGDAEARAIVLAARLLEDLNGLGAVYSDSQEAVTSTQALVPGWQGVTALVWTPHEHNRAADVLSKVMRQTWQGLRKRRLSPPMSASVHHRASAPLSVMHIVRPRGTRHAAPIGEGAPASLEQAIVALASEGAVPTGDLHGRIEARWPDLLALRGRPEHSVRDALRSLLRKGVAMLDEERAVVVTAAPAAPSQEGEPPP